MARLSTERVLRSYLSLGATSRAEVARTTGLSLPTVSEVTEVLVNQGILVPTREVVPSRGRPALLLEVRPRQFSTVAVDIDDSGLMSSVITDLAGETYATGRFHIAQESLQDVFAQLRAWIEEHRTTAPPALCLTIGAPGIVYPHREMVQTAVHLGWHDVHLGSLLEELTLPRHVASRASFYALAETRQWGRPYVRDALCLWVGSAIGGAVIRNGQVVDKPRAHHPEFGHIVVRMGGEPCTCGSRGCLEAEYFSARSAQPDAAVDVLSTGIASLVNLYAPNLVILGGHNVAEDPSAVSRIQAAVAQQALPVSTQPVEIRLSKTGAHPQLAGAVIHAREMAAAILAERIDRAVPNRRRTEVSTDW